MGPFPFRSATLASDLVFVIPLRRSARPLGDLRALPLETATARAGHDPAPLLHHAPARRRDHLLHRPGAHDRGHVRRQQELPGWAVAVFFGLAEQRDRCHFLRDVVFDHVLL